MDRLKLLRGQPLKIDFFTIYPFTVGQIADIGELKYQEYCAVLALEIKEKHVKEMPEALKELDKFQLFALVMKSEKALQDSFLEALRFVTQEPAFEALNGVFFLGKYFLKEQHLAQIRKFIEAQNLIEPETEYNLADDKAAEIQRKIQANKEEVARIKSRNHEGPDFSDLISALISKSEGSFDYKNIWDLTYFQFREALVRCQLVDNYDLSIRQILAGADPKKMEVKHWLAKINN